MTTISRSISRPITNKIVSDILNPQVRRDNAIFDPSQIQSLQARILDGTVYGDKTALDELAQGVPLHSDPTFGCWPELIIDSHAENPAVLPRQGRCHTFISGDYISVPSLTGSETVVSKEGTATVTITAGRITPSAGTLWNLVLSNGSIYDCNEETGYVVLDRSGNGRHGDIIAPTNGTLHTINNSIQNRNNIYGYEQFENWMGQSENISAWSLSSSTITTDAITAPNGTLTADLVTETAPIAAITRNFLRSIPLRTSTVSFSVKRGNTDWIRVAIGNTITDATPAIRAWINLNTGTLGTVAADNSGGNFVTIISSSISSQGNGWYRVVLTFRITLAAGTTMQVRSASDNGSFINASSATYYIWGVQVVYKLTNRPYVEGKGSYTGIRLSPAVNNTTSATNGTLSVRRCSYPIVSKCIGFSGGTNTVLDTGLSLIPATGNFSIQLYLRLLANAAPRGFFETNTLALNSVGQFRLWFATGQLRLGVPNGTTLSLGSISAYAFRTVQVNIDRTNDIFTLSIDGVEYKTTTISNPITTGALRLGVSHSNPMLNLGFESIYSVSVTANGVTTYIPLQEGPGTSNNNRDVHWVDTAGNSGVITNAISGGDISSIWGGGRSLVEVRDWCLLYGGRVNNNGVFVPGIPNSNLCADGQPKTLSPGKFGNPNNRLNFNPFGAPELVSRGVPTDWKIGDNFTNVITPTDSAFLRSKPDGVDRILLFENSLTGSDKTNVQKYVG